MPFTDQEAQRLRELKTELMEMADRAGEIVRGIDKAISDSDRRAEAYLPILRRAGIVPPKRRPRWW